MKFKCDQKTLIKALNIVSKGVSNRTTLPVLKGILLSVNEKGELKLMSSDLEISIEETILVTDYEEGSIVVLAKSFSDFIRKLPSGMVTVEEISGKINIKCQRSSLDLVGMSSDEFPIINSNEADYDTITLDKNTIKEMIRKTAFAASVDETKGTLTGVLMELKDQKLTMVAIDGYRMALTRSFTDSSNEKSIIISAKLMNEINKIISESNSDSESLEIRISNKRAVFIIDTVKVILRLLEGNFTPYERVIPPNNKINVRINRRDLLDSIDRAALLSNDGKNNLIKITVEDDAMTIVADSEEGKIEESISISKTGDDLQIGFNVKYMMDILKNIDDEFIIMKLDTPISACLIEPDNNGNEYLYLILPIRITGN